jgi:hypothetical protein
MSDQRDMIQRGGSYIAATVGELDSAGIAARTAAVFNQRVLFPHRGRAELLADRLVLRGWDRNQALIIEAAQVTKIRRMFTGSYGRFLGGGSAEWGAPIIISRVTGDEIYVLFDHRAFLEKSSNVDWHLDLLGWHERTSRE